MIELIIHIAVQAISTDVPQKIVSSFETYQYEQSIKNRITRNVIEEIELFVPKPVKVGSLMNNQFDTTQIPTFSSSIYKDVNFDELLPAHYYNENLNNSFASASNVISNSNSNANNLNTNNIDYENLRIYYEDQFAAADSTDWGTIEEGQTENIAPNTSNTSPSGSDVLGTNVISSDDYHPPPGTKPQPQPESKIPDKSEITDQGFKLHINKLNIKDVPLLPTDIYNKDIWFEDLKKGVGHYIDYPGNGHKVLLFGHSSNYEWVDSDYNYVFKDLNTLENGNIITIDYNGKRYQNKVSKKEITGKYVPSVVTDYGREELVMFTCWPYLTSNQRLIVYADPLF